jgi:hypothetical protein
MLKVSDSFGSFLRSGDKFIWVGFAKAHGQMQYIFHHGLIDLLQL